MTEQELVHQYRTADLLRIRAETHRLYTEDPVDLDAECAAMLGLRSGESLLDVGCGPGVFLRYLRARGQAGRLAGLDQSAGMIAAAEAASAAESSAGEAPDIEWYVGEADALPFPDGTFTAVSARHMLYHVPDIPAALREFARVTVPGGTILAATNGAGNLPYIAALENDAIAHFGLGEAPGVEDPFRTANAESLLAPHFAEIRETILPMALVFEDSAPIVRYILSRFGAQRAAGDPELFAELHAWLTAQAGERIAAMGGVWRDPKSVGLYACRETAVS